MSSASAGRHSSEASPPAPRCRLRWASPSLSPDSREWRISEQAVRDDATAWSSGCLASEVVADDAKVIEGCMRELRTSRALTERPDILRRRLEAFVDHDVSAIRQRDTHRLRARCPSCLVSARRRLECRFPSTVRSALRAREQLKTYVSSGTTRDVHALRRTTGSRCLQPQGCAVSRPPISGSSRLMSCEPLLDDGHPAAEATVGLGEFEADVAAA